MRGIQSFTPNKVTPHVHNILYIASAYELFIESITQHADGAYSPTRSLMHLGLRRSREAMELGVGLF